MKKLLIPVVLLMLTTLACKKKNEPSNPVGTTNFKTYASMDEVSALLAQQSKVVIFDASAGQSFYTDNGVRYIFQPNCFWDAGGVVVTGNVQVEVTEYLKKGDMIFSGVLPLSDGMSLISGGEINVKATKNGQPLRIDPLKPFEAKISQRGSKDTVMSFFGGETNGGTTNNKVNWVQNKDSLSGKLIYKGDTISIFSDSARYCNADRFLNNPNYQSFKVNVVATGATIDAANLYGYALFDQYNGFWPLTTLSGTTFDEHHVPDIPVHFVVYSLINGHFYGGVFGATPATGKTYTVTLTEVDPKDFKAQINGLY